jgi:hypothetical protein
LDVFRCKRFRELGQSRVVLARASPRCLAVRAKAWSDDAHRFLQRCADAGNLEACYLLGMVRIVQQQLGFDTRKKEKSRVVLILGRWSVRRSGSTAWAAAGRARR